MAVGGNNDIGGYYRYWVSNMHKFSQQSFNWDIFHIHHDACDEVDHSMGERRRLGGKLKVWEGEKHLKGRNVFLYLLIIFPLGPNSTPGQCPGFLTESKLIVLWPASLPLRPTHKCGLSVLHWPGLKGRESCWHEVLKYLRDHRRPPYTKTASLKRFVSISLWSHPPCVQVGNSSCARPATRICEENQSSLPFYLTPHAKAWINQDCKSQTHDRYFCLSVKIKFHSLSFSQKAPLDSHVRTQVIVGWCSLV